MSSNNYMNLFMNALITDRRVQEKYVRYLDAVLAQEGIGVDDIVGVGEEGTGGALDPLYVVHKQAVSVASQVSRFNKRIEVRRLCPIASIANLRAAEEGFKGRDVTLTATDPRGDVVLKIVWGLGGPDWVEPLIMRQRQHMFEVIGEAMDGLSEAAARPSVASASSKAGALDGLGR